MNEGAIFGDMHELWNVSNLMGCMWEGYGSENIP
jgi:hypothetical protein